MDLNILQLLLFLCMKILVSGVGAAAEVRCIEREKQALLKFLGDLSGLTWGSEENKGECCDWDGVECTDTGHVVSINPLTKLLRGKISPALRELKHLQSLSLHSDNLATDNLDWLSDLSSLYDLNLSGCNLRNVTNWVQPISKLSSLKELYLSGCQLHDSLSTFDVFANSTLSDLSSLDLSYNNLTSISTFDSMFNFSRSLEQVDLSYNQLDGHIPHTFLELRSLRDLNLRGNLLRGVHKPLENFSHLQSVDISFNKLNVPLPHLFENLSEIISLQRIDLSNNQLVGSLPDISRFSSLENFYLSNNQLEGVQPQSLDQPSSLKFLDLSYNQISGSLLDFGGFSSLYELDLSGNQLKKLPKAMEQLYNITYLNLSSTSLEGTVTEHHISNLTRLRHLDLSFNNVSFNSRFDWIPTFQLEQLSLSHCNIGPYFPNWIRKQNSLENLYLSFAGISNTIPDWLWNMSSIQHLDLSHNNISGRIPHSPTNLDFVDLSYNNLSGPIPLSVFQNSSALILSENLLSGSIFNLCTISEKFFIHTLILPNNELDGELPNCWMNFYSLVYLNLANNKFSGKLPPTLGTLTSLTILHLGNNNFIGELPSSLKNCKALRKLDVGGNKLTGTIPSWIGTHLIFLEVLSLRFNSFHGSIPPTICYLINIHVLDLSRNIISGKIPRCLNNFTFLVLNDGSSILSDDRSWNFNWEPEDEDDNALVQWKRQESEYKRLRNLKGIDLSSNKLVGTIPQAFFDLRGLVFINLSRNHLTGNIISSIGQLDTLEWLDLSRNQLSGEIPNSLANLHFLSVLDLSYNNLIGKIPRGTQLQSFDSSTYVGNSQLCGDPLVECPHYPSVNDHGKINVVEEDDRFINRDFYICMVFGFITGFWIVIGTLILKHSWRHSYFKFLNDIGDWMYVTTTIYVTRLKRKFMS
ncbi:receptor-like protein 12 [Olea europaea var. sylvestris]|uniref:receptor-like protein 12 n=1 Tax=Olea europaea var. sylvestris TaxID=158386 RepID=UPI000C1D29B7|nr:receptor-like protein 12 [Olea europaea var. sylvestris]